MYGRRPLTKLEAALYAGAVGVLIVVFVEYALGYMETAERAAMQATLLNTTSAVNVRVAQAMLGATPALADVSRRNPFEFAGTRPANYQRIGLPRSSSGQWTYDEEQRELVYSPRLHSGLHTRTGEPELRFRLVRVGAGYAFEATIPYRWE